MTLSTTGSSVRAGIAALRANPLRTTLSALGVVIGVGAMISVLALSDGVERSVRDQMSADGRLLTIRLTPRTTESFDGQELPRARFPRFDGADADALARAVAPAARSVNLLAVGPALLTPPDGGPPRGVAVRAVRTIPPELLDAPLLAGRAFSAPEVAAGARVLVLSDDLAAALASPAPPDARAGAPAAPPTASRAACAALVGRSVRIREASWTILGVLAATDTAAEVAGCGRLGRAPVLPDGERRPLVAYAPITSAPAALLPTGRPFAPALQMVAASVEVMPRALAGAERWAAARAGAPPATASDTAPWRREIAVASYAAESDLARRGLLMFKLLMGALTGVSLVVGGVGIMNVLLASVTERTREIGISKAVGARRRDVLVQFLAEAVAISGVGALLGTGLGLAVAHAVAALMRAQAAMPVQAGFSVATLLVAVGAPLLVGLGFGVYPALRAARLSPIDAIRHE